MIREINFHSSRLVFLSSFKHHRWSTDNSHCLLVSICDGHKSRRFQPVSAFCGHASKSGSGWVRSMAWHRHAGSTGTLAQGLSLNALKCDCWDEGQQISRRLPTAHSHGTFPQLLPIEQAQHRQPNPNEGGKGLQHWWASQGSESCKQRNFCLL